VFCGYCVFLEYVPILSTSCIYCVYLEYVPILSTSCTNCVCLEYVPVLLTNYREEIVMNFVVYNILSVNSYRISGFIVERFHWCKLQNAGYYELRLVRFDSVTWPGRVLDCSLCTSPCVYALCSSAQWNYGHVCGTLQVGKVQNMQQTERGRQLLRALTNFNAEFNKLGNVYRA
jgi:hypothetical protein